MTVARTSIALLVIQLALVSSIAAKYLYQRQTCPKVWTRAAAFDPETVMRGRYLSTQLKIDACGIKMPLAHDQTMASDNQRTYFDPRGDGTLSQLLEVTIGVKNGTLVAEHIAKSPQEHNSQSLSLRKGVACSEATLWTPVDFYLPEHAIDPLATQRSSGQELWVEVTIPPAGPPRPLGLAIKTSDGQWQPLNYR
jgi:uncharacterized membrane-anchored protein